MVLFRWDFLVAIRFDLVLENNVSFSRGNRPWLHPEWPTRSNAQRPWGSNPWCIKGAFSFRCQGAHTTAQSKVTHKDRRTMATSTDVQEWFDHAWISLSQWAINQSIPGSQGTRYELNSAQLCNRAPVEGSLGIRFKYNENNDEMIFILYLFTNSSLAHSDCNCKGFNGRCHYAWNRGGFLMRIAIITIIFLLKRFLPVLTNWMIPLSSLYRVFLIGTLLYINKVERMGGTCWKCPL